MSEYEKINEKLRFYGFRTRKGEVGHIKIKNKIVIVIQAHLRVIVISDGTLGKYDIACFLDSWVGQRHYFRFLFTHFTINKL